MRKGAAVTVKMSKGLDRPGKFVRKETNRGEWYVIKDAAGTEFKARPSSVTPV